MISRHETVSVLLPLAVILSTSKSSQNIHGGLYHTLLAGSLCYVEKMVTLCILNGQKSFRTFSREKNLPFILKRSNGNFKNSLKKKKRMNNKVLVLVLMSDRVESRK